MGIQAQKLRGLINSGEHVIAADCYSALTGRIIEHVGFKAAYAGGHACGAFHFAVPDYGLYSQAEHVDVCARIAAAMDIPLIADADTLGDTITEAYHFTRRYEQAGIAGIHIEDEVNPRHSSYVNGLLPIVDMQARIEASASARSDPAFVIIARCDEFYWKSHTGVRTGSIEEAIKRGKAYAEAGADLLMYPIVSPENHAILVEELPVPICVIGASLPGTTLTLAGGWGWLGAAQLHMQRARTLFETGSLSVDPVLEHKAELIDQQLYDDVIRKWAERTGRPVW
ncbi:MAG TPA: isocitrate lyase/PEP mutase family protein [Sphingobium sp.]|nr:isocitrate lyase/PEP mutase family protein [Sphingobium sp.]